jgi:hypothetical protein
MAAAERMGVSSWRYQQIVNYLADSDEAATLAPSAVARLHARRTARRAVRHRDNEGC